MTDRFIPAENVRISDRSPFRLARSGRAHLYSTGVATLDILRPALLNPNFGLILLALITFAGGVLYGVFRPTADMDTSSVFDANILASDAAQPLESPK
ncbi:MAG: hypothetical protein JWM91_1284 [Rhodospirillales bacterium]|nr:hypothetical protein [Rhodospirillales bacterium]